MATIKELNKLIEDGDSLRLISQALSEISALRLNKIRTSTEHNRSFFAEISKVYHMIKIIAAQKKIHLPSNNKTISVLLTSNFKFTGFASNQLIRYFVKNSSLFATDRLVIGRSGNQALSIVANTLSFQPLNFKDDLPSYAELKTLANIIISYEKVLVFYTKFESMLSQNPAVTDIKESASQVETPVEELSYIFEPEIKKVLAFFDTQINILLLEQTFLESELSRVAIRLINMSQAEKKADQFLSEQQVKLGLAKKSVGNLRLLENLISQIKFRRQYYG